MDYVVGSVAALISGNVTPNRPKAVRKALTPIKHQQSPNVTPKSESVEDRSIFLSPTLQKKKAIVKKSPKRIFQTPDLDTTNGSDGDSNEKSPKADKVKKHLKDDLEAEVTKNKSEFGQKSPKKRNNSESSLSPKKKFKSNQNIDQIKVSSDNISENKDLILETQETLNQAVENPAKLGKSPKKKRKNINTDHLTDIVSDGKVKKVKSIESHEESNKTNNNIFMKNKTEKNLVLKKDKSITKTVNASQDGDKVEKSQLESTKTQKKKNKKRKKKSKNQNETIEASQDNEEKSVQNEIIKEQTKNKVFVNPNAVTDKDSDSEHESDDNIDSDTEQSNKEAFVTAPEHDSSDDEEKNVETTKKQPESEKKFEATSEEEIKRTLFVGNVPFSKKIKKDLKKIFSKHGTIDTVRIRTVPVKDARTTPKLAVIKNELHPERSTVNVYIKYSDAASVEKALVENNTVYNEHHLRVSRSSVSGAEHDPRLAVFVGNIPFGLEDDGLRAKFQGCGQIQSVRIVRDKATGAGKGFGYVNFASKDGVELALALSEEDMTIKNRILRVKRCSNLPHKLKSGKKENPAKAKGKFVPWDQKEQTGAYRRLMHKRKNPEGGGDGPPNKRQRDINQPNKEKKVRKEFVGMTAEKKKKNKFNKGQKKKKALSEILTK